ncbi:MAG: hypothetical protein VXZ82_16800 [Planctomycetota bacterium]|nr:hypothetical protein [Planctomycetota bacterium]
MGVKHPSAIRGVPNLSASKVLCVNGSTLHEIGHYCYLVTNRRSCYTRCESCVGDFGRRNEAEIFDDYVSVFGFVAWKIEDY